MAESRSGTKACNPVPDDYDLHQEALELDEKNVTWWLKFPNPSPSPYCNLSADPLKLSIKEKESHTPIMAWATSSVISMT
jgi:hypothetical protein